MAGKGDTGEGLKGRTAVVTGASSGIGRAIALCFGRKGARVALMARRKDRLDEVKAEIEKAGGEALVVPADLGKPEEISEAFARIRREWGDPDILVNNAGVGVHGPLVDQTLADYDRVFDLNMRALFLATNEVLPAMLRRKSGDIVNISSIAGKMGLANSALYCASKFAVMGLSEALLEEVREKNVRVTVISPGAVDTEIFGPRVPQADRKNMIRPENVAEAALLAVSGTQNATYKEIIIRPRRPVP